MRLALTSDLHGHLPAIPKADILVIAGDITPMSLTRQDDLQLHWLETKLRPWLEAAPVKAVVAVAGNHDHAFKRRRSQLRALPMPWHYLEDEEVEVMGLRFWGSPWSPTFGTGWAFNAGLEKQRSVYDLIPKGLDVLVSHGPPYGIGDRTLEGVQTGSYIMADVLDEVTPRLTVFGHIHEGRGSYETSWGDLVNASQCDRNYRMIPEVITWEIS